MRLSLGVLAVAAVGLARASRLHVRVATVSATADADAPFACPLGVGYDAPLVLLTCPQACGASSVCVFYPETFRSYCSGAACLDGDSCAVQCVPISDEWVLRTYARELSMEDYTTNNTLRVNGSVVSGVGLVEGWSLSKQLTKIAIVGKVQGNGTDSGETAELFEIPESFFDRVGPQATSISLENVAFAEQTYMGGTLGVFKKLEQLHVVNAGLVECPVEPSQVPELSTLNVSGNSVHSLPAGSLPEELQVLDASNNALTSFPAGVASLKDLRELNLANNGLRSIANSSFPKSSTLRSLDVSNTSLTSVPDAVNKLKSLRVLSISGNDLSKAPASCFARLSKTIVEIHANSAGLQNVPTGLSRHSNLTKLSLASNNFSRRSQIDCSVLPKSLKSLNLSLSGLRQLPKGLANLTSLTELDLSGNAFRGSINGSQLPSNLATLILDNCSLAVFPQSLNKLAKLKTLSLRNNLITASNLTKQIPHITNLFLDGTSIVKLDEFPTTVKSITGLSCLNCTKLASLPALPQSLRTLELSAIAMTTVKKGTLPAKLATLKITDAASLRDSPQDLGKMTALTELSLARCNLTSFSAGSNLQTVEVLSLEGNAMVTFSGSLLNATSINLRGNQLQALNLTNATALTQLDLSNNNFSAFPVAVFAMSALQSLRLEGNPIEYFEPTQDQSEFLQNLSSLVMDQRQFFAECVSSTQVKQYSLCISGEASGESSGSGPTGSMASETSTKKKSSHAAAVFLLLLIAMCVLAMLGIVWRRRKHQTKRRMMREEKEALEAARSPSTPSMASWDTKSLDDYRFEPELLVKSRRIGASARTEVWLAIYSARRVAVKHLKPQLDTPEAVERFTREAKLVASLRHAKIVEFIGVAWSKPADLALVTAFAERGDLQRYLETRPRAEDGSWEPRKLRIALDVAEALVYLHTLNPIVVHRAVRSKHVLLDETLQAKLTAFGLARCAPVASSLLDEQEHTEQLFEDSDAGVRWVAPEVLNASLYDASADIFSFGVLLGEIDTHALPYASVVGEDGQPLKDVAVRTRVADGTLRLALSNTCPREVASLALRCSTYEAADRPKAAQVARELRQLLAAVSAQAANTENEPEAESV